MERYYLLGYRVAVSKLFILYSYYQAGSKRPGKFISVQKKRSVVLSYTSLSFIGF